MLRKQIYSYVLGLCFVFFLGFAFSESVEAETGGTVPVESVPLENMLEALILKEGVEIMANNIKAAERESGDIDKAIRATLGISIADIKKYGLLGGPNSEMRKLAEALGMVDKM